MSDLLILGVTLFSTAFGSVCLGYYTSQYQLRFQVPEDKDKKELPPPSYYIQPKRKPLQDVKQACKMLESGIKPKTFYIDRGMIHNKNSNTQRAASPSELRLYVKALAEYDKIQLAEEEINHLTETVQRLND